MGLFSRTKSSPQVSRVIDLREPVPAAPQWGSPVPCPECSGRGYLDHIDPYREVMYMHCTQCYTKYELAKTDLDAEATVAEPFTV